MKLGGGVTDSSGYKLPPNQRNQISVADPGKGRTTYMKVYTFHGLSLSIDIGFGVNEHPMESRIT